MPGSAEYQVEIPTGGDYTFWLRANTEMVVGVMNPSITEAVLLDANGMVVRGLSGRRRGDNFVLELPPEAIYVILR